VWNRKDLFQVSDLFHGGQHGWRRLGIFIGISVVSPAHHDGVRWDVQHPRHAQSLSFELRLAVPGNSHIDNNGGGSGGQLVHPAVHTGYIDAAEGSSSGETDPFRTFYAPVGSYELHPKSHRTKYFPI